MSLPRATPPIWRSEVKGRRLLRSHWLRVNPVPWSQPPPTPTWSSFSTSTPTPRSRCRGTRSTTPCTGSRAPVSLQRSLRRSLSRPRRTRRCRDLGCTAVLGPPGRRRLGRNRGPDGPSHAGVRARAQAVRQCRSDPSQACARWSPEMQLRVEPVRALLDLATEGIRAQRQRGSPRRASGGCQLHRCHPGTRRLRVHRRIPRRRPAPRCDQPPGAGQGDAVCTWRGSPSVGSACPGRAAAMTVDKAPDGRAVPGQADPATASAGRAPDPRGHPSGRFPPGGQASRQRRSWPSSSA